MKILANKEIKNLFLSLSLVLGVTFLLAEIFLWLSYRRLSLLLLILFLLAGGPGVSIRLKMYSSPSLALYTIRTA